MDFGYLNIFLHMEYGIKGNLNLRMDSVSRRQFSEMSSQSKLDQP